jgi:hypothetical protein
MEKLKKILLVLLAGAFGGLVNSLAIWLFGALGITPALGFNFAPTLSLPWLLSRIVPSALWGLLFLVPFLKRSLYRKGMVLSIPLWLVMLLMIFPKKMQAGMFGLSLGAGAPVWALCFTQVWGLSAAFLLKKMQK